MVLIFSAYIHKLTVLNLVKHFNLQLKIHQLYPKRMINFFLQQQQNLPSQIKKIIRQNCSQKRKYQPFHIDCSFTKKKICYCINNPVMNVNIDSRNKQQIYQKYQQADNYYLGTGKKNKEIADQHLDKIKTKIQCLSKKEVVDFVKSIQKQKNLMGQIIEY